MVSLLKLIFSWLMFFTLMLFYYHDKNELDFIFLKVIMLIANPFKHFSKISLDITRMKYRIQFIFKYNGESCGGILVINSCLLTFDQFLIKILPKIRSAGSI